MPLVIRNKEAESDPGHPFHHLMTSIPWPEGGISASRGMTLQGMSPWSIFTIGDKLRQKREKMEENLRRKREYAVVRRVPLYVWVFWCPGVSGFIFRGWFTYLIGVSFEANVNFKGGLPAMQRRLMELFPLTEPGLWDDCDERVFDRWQKEFVKRYPRGLRLGKPQGKAPVWAEVRTGYYGNIPTITRLLSRAEWQRREAAA